MTETNLEAPKAPEENQATSGIFASKPKEPEVKAEKPKAESKIDHLGQIAELASSLHNVSPSGAETVRDKILEHVAAIQDPKAYDERMAAEKKAEDELEAQRAKDRAANKQPVPEKVKA